MLIAKTEAGQRVLKDRSVPLTPRQRSAFILFDGKRTVDEVLKATAAAGVTREDVDKLIELGLLGAMAAQAPAAAAATRAPKRTMQEMYARAYPIATQLTGGLGLRGFRLNMAVEGASNYMDLLAVAPRIREAVGEEKYQPLSDALDGL